MSVSVQTEDFDLSKEISSLQNADCSAGAIVTFSGIVRQNSAGTLRAMELEHYPAMTLSALEKIEAEAKVRWELVDSRIIHRVGMLELGAQIMMVAVAAPHRTAAFEAADFLMDFLKSRAPFWKKEHLSDGASDWVSALETDEARLLRWSKD